MSGFMFSYLVLLVRGGLIKRFCSFLRDGYCIRFLRGVGCLFIDASSRLRSAVVLWY